MDHRYTIEDMREMVLRLAHEIRNPLATITSAAQLVKRLGLSAEDAVPYLDDVIAEVSRIDSTVRGMERFIRLDRSSPSAVVIAQAVADVVDARQPSSEAARIMIRPSGDGFRALVDPQHLRIALDELLDNARRFTPPGTGVEISWGAATRHRVCVRVDDNGPGVADEHADRILRPFFSTSTQGIGLGLNIVQSICRLAEGSFGWENLDRGGCRFTMTFREA